MPVKSVPSMGWTRRSASVSVLLAMDDYREQAGRRLRELREQRGMSQEELAGAAKLSVKTISRFENGKHDGRRGTLRQLAEALHVTEEIITGPPPAPLGLGVSPEQSQLDRIEARLERIESLLSGDDGLIPGVLEFLQEAQATPAAKRRRTARTAK